MHYTSIKLTFIHEQYTCKPHYKQQPLVDCVIKFLLLALNSSTPKTSWVVKLPLR